MSTHTSLHANTLHTSGMKPLSNIYKQELFNGDFTAKPP